MAPGKGKPKVEFDIDVNYQESFQKYMAHLTTKFLIGPDRCIKPITINIVNAIVKTIKRAKRKMVLHIPLYEIETSLIDLYDITDKKDSLILKSKNQEKQQRKVISCEEAFSFIETIHRDTTGHGTWTTVKNYMKKHLDYLYIYEESYCISLIINLCSLCTPIFNAQCSFYVTEIELERKYSFKKVLILVDGATNFIRLRPLTSDSENELAIELLKTFTDFGIPKIMISPDNTLLERVLLVINSLLPDYPMPKVSTGTNRSIYYKNLITNKLKECKTQKNTNNWPILCHMVQWNLNTSTSAGRKSSYSIVFGQNAKKIRMSTAQCSQQQMKPPMYTYDAPATTKIDEKANKILNSKEKTADIVKLKNKKKKITQEKKKVISFEYLYNLPIGDTSNNVIDLTDDNINDGVDKLALEDVRNDDGENVLNKSLSCASGEDVELLEINEQVNNGEGSVCSFTHKFSCNDCKQPVSVVVNNQLDVLTSGESTFCDECKKKNATKELLRTMDDEFEKQIKPFYVYKKTN